MLSPAQHAFFKNKIPASLNAVRIHTGPEAALSAKAIQAKAYTAGNHIVFGEGYYKPETTEGRKLLAHELAHVAQQQNDDALRRTIRCERELDGDEAKACMVKLEEVIKKLEAAAADEKRALPDGLKKAIKLLREKKTAGKIKCYYFEGITHGRMDFDKDEIQVDARNLNDVNETTVLHEGVHAQHGKDYPTAAKKYGKARTEGVRADPQNPSEELKELYRFKAWSEYQAYRSNYDYQNNTRKTPMTEEEIHNAVMSNKDVLMPVNKVRAFDSKFDPRTWKPKS